jgi:alanine dehydrogenase
MPGAVPWTATQALNNSTLPYVLKMADGGLGQSKLMLNYGWGKCAGWNVDSSGCTIDVPAARFVVVELKRP